MHYQKHPTTLNGVSPSTKSGCESKHVDVVDYDNNRIPSRCSDSGIIDKALEICYIVMAKLL
jgi:hypothetical protein